LNKSNNKKLKKAKFLIPLIENAEKIAKIEKVLANGVFDSRGILLKKPKDVCLESL
jgi:hypothetical protein